RIHGQLNDSSRRPQTDFTRRRAKVHSAVRHSRCRTRRSSRTALASACAPLCISTATTGTASPASATTALRILLAKDGQRQEQQPRHYKSRDSFHRSGPHFPDRPSISSISFPRLSTTIAVFKPSAFGETGFVTLTPSPSTFLTKASIPLTSSANRSRIVPL